MITHRTIAKWFMDGSYIADLARRVHKQRRCRQNWTKDYVCKVCNLYVQHAIRTVANRRRRR